MFSLTQSIKTDSKSANQSTNRLLSLVEYLSEQPEPMRISDIAQGCGMNVSTVHRFLTALQARGYAVQDPENGRYSLTFKFCRIGNSIRARTDLREISLPYLHAIAQEFGDTVGLAIEYDMAVMYQETFPGPLRSGLSLNAAGGLGPLHATAAGKLFLSCYDARKLEQFLAIKGMPALTPATITSLPQLRKELLKIRVRGYASDHQESVSGAQEVAAPIKDFTNQVVAAITVRGPVSRMTEEYIQKHLPLLLESTAAISARMGYEPQRESLPAYRR